MSCRPPRGGALGISRGLSESLGVSRGLSGPLGASHGLSGSLRVSWGLSGPLGVSRGLSESLGVSRGLSLAKQTELPWERNPQRHYRAPLRFSPGRRVSWENRGAWDTIKIQDVVQTLLCPPAQSQRGQGERGPRDAICTAARAIPRSRGGSAQAALRSWEARAEAWPALRPEPPSESLAAGAAAVRPEP